jgi:hypothetical protein
MSHRCRSPRPCRGHVGPPAPPPPTLAPEIPLLIRLERQVEDAFRPQMREHLQRLVAEQDAALRGTAPRCPTCGGAMKSRGRRRSPFITRFGNLSVPASAYRCRKCGKHRTPLLERLGVEAGHVSGMLARLLALLGVVVPYELAAQLAHLCFGVSVSPMTVWRTVQRLGAACEHYLEEQATFHSDGRNNQEELHRPGVDAVIIGVDGAALGMQVHPQRRRRVDDQPLPPLPPVEEGHFREVKTAVLLQPAERYEPTPGRHSVVRRVLCTCLGDADQIFARLRAKLHTLGWLGTATVVVLVGDGAEWLWNRAALFPQRCEILDFWHAIEKAWTFARARYGDGSAHASRWISRLADDLRAGRVGEVLLRLQQLKAKTEEQQEALDALVRYYTDNRDRMRYDEYRRKGYGIGSGAVESAHKQVLQARLRQAGMRWSEAGARHLLALRVLLLNGEWSLLDRLAMRPLAA